MDQVVFIVDLNELQDGDMLPVAMDYTVNHGPGVRVSTVHQPVVDEWVRIHSDNDETLYYAQVTRIVSERDFWVRVNWDSCTPVLNRIEWSARDMPVTVGASAMSV